MQRFSCKLISDPYVSTDLFANSHYDAADKFKDIIMDHYRDHPHKRQVLIRGFHVKVVNIHGVAISGQYIIDNNGIHAYNPKPVESNNGQIA